MSDEGFHEIQLNSKQVIFLCMTAALVLVVAFLSGVLVGRGVRTEKDASLAAAEAATATSTAPAETPAAQAPAAQAAAPPPAVAPPTPADEDLTYEKRLAGQQPPKETLKGFTAQQPASGAAPAPAKGAADQAAAPRESAKEAGKPAPAAKDATPAKEATSKAAAPADAAKTQVAASLPGEPAGPGYYLKIVALRDRDQAEAVAKRLNGKGYTSYVVPMSGKGPVLYSVRVGKYKTRQEADTVKRRLEKEEQYKPLISH